jgi:hypothetical protein
MTENAEVQDNLEQPPEQPPADNPPGFLSKEEYIAKGGDPERWRPVEAYKDQYHKIQENRAQAKKIKELERMTDSFTDLLEQQQAQQKANYEREISKLKQQLNKQKEEYDTEGALDTHDQIKSLEAEKSKIQSKKPESKEEPAATEMTPHQDITLQFIRENPIINAQHKDYDPKIGKKMGELVNTYHRDNMSNEELSQMLHNSLQLSRSNTMEPEKQPRRARSTGQPESKGVKQSTEMTRDDLDDGYKKIYDHHKLKGTADGDKKAAKLLELAGKRQ